MNKEEDNSTISIEDLYPGHSPDWYAEAEENLQAYLALVVRVYQRISEDPEELARLRAELNC